MWGGSIALRQYWWVIELAGDWWAGIGVPSHRLGSKEPGSILLIQVRGVGQVPGTDMQTTSSSLS